jgi:Double zinc ribbon
VNDLERFFTQLVRNVAADDRTRLGKPLLLGEIRNSIVPYRANRRALELESSEDYELVLMRLCAGEGGLARTGPDEVGDEFRKEVASPNPDLTLAERHEKAIVHLDPRFVAKALDPKPHLAYAPREQAASSPESPVVSKVKRASPKPPTKPQQCRRCGGALPAGRVVNFCPQCGQDLTRAHCAECQTELEPGWRHCVNCGAAVSQP